MPFPTHTWRGLNAGTTLTLMQSFSVVKYCSSKQLQKLANSLPVLYKMCFLYIVLSLKHTDFHRFFYAFASPVAK